MFFKNSFFKLNNFGLEYFYNFKYMFKDSIKKYMRLLN